MGFSTIGSIIEKARLEKKGISRKKLAAGLCSEQRLYDIEKDNCESDTLLVDILLQRLGKSPDKLERVLQADMYRMVRLRDLLEEAILRGKKQLAERILDTYPLLTKVDRMYKCRMTACLLYRIEADYAGAIEQLQKAIDITLPEFTYEKIERYLISTVEMENLLALERMKTEENKMQVKTEEKRHLEILMGYIDRHFTDEEEHAKIYSKCAWLLARVCFAEENYRKTISLCEKGMEGLRRNTMLYFMFPLLKLMTEAEKQLGIASEKSKWVQYYETLTFLWEGYARKWYPTDLLFHNCYQKEYHLDYELIRSEREARGMTQEEMAEGIYQNVESYSRFETGKASPQKRTFEMLMGKIGMEKGRYNGYAVTNSFETMEIRRNLDRLLSHGEYPKAEEMIKKLKANLNMDIQENKQMIYNMEMVIERNLHRLTYEQILDKQKELLNGIVDYRKQIICHIPMRNEVLLINNICISLEKTKQMDNARRLYEIVLQKIQKSKVDVRYRYRSYSLLLSNYTHISWNCRLAYKSLKNELVCGKTSILPLCLNTILILLQREGKSEQEYLKWAKAVYYMSDLFIFEKEKECFASYLREKCHVDIIF